MKLPTVFLPVLLVFVLPQSCSVRGNQIAQVYDNTKLKIPTCWKNTLFRSDVLHNSTSDLAVISDFLVGVIENFRQDMKTGIPNLEVPVFDPFLIPEVIKINIKKKMASVQGNFSSLRVQGLSGFSMDLLNANLHDLSLMFSLRLPRIYASGYYAIRGKLIKFVPLWRNGTFWIELKNLILGAAASIESTDDGYLQLGNDFDICIDFREVRMDFENLLGGRKLAEILKDILNMISKDLLKKSLPFLKGELKKDLRKVINKNLMKLPIKFLMPGRTANEYVDQILSQVRQYMKDKHYDPLKLPDYVSKVSKMVLSVRLYCEAKLYNGRLSGISSIHRTDECKLNSSSETISLSAHLGLKNLRLEYKGYAKFMNWGPLIECGGSVPYVTFFIRVQQSNAQGATPHLSEMKILEMSDISVELSGLGPLTWMTKWILNGIFRLIRDVIVNEVTKHLKRYLEQEFQKFKFLK